FVDGDNPAAMKQAEFDLMQTAITQPAMLTMDTAVYELLAEYGIHPDMVMGHSLGEYGALIAAGIMHFSDALEASAARGREMTAINNLEDNGWMAAVIGPLDVILETLKQVDGYVIPANINSYNQVVIGGASKAVEQAINLFNQKGMQAMRIPVSHAFHTRIVAPASQPLRKVLDRLEIHEPQLSLVANVTGDIYPTTVEGIKDILEQQVAATVQWVKGMETLYAHGCRMFIEVGPKKALKGFADDVLGDKPDVVSLFTNHPKFGELPTFNQALCGLYAAGYGAEPVLSETKDGKWQVAGDGQSAVVAATQPAPVMTMPAPAPVAPPAPAPLPPAPRPLEVAPMPQPAVNDALALLAQAISNLQSPISNPRPFDRNDAPLGSIVVSGTGLGLPGAEKPVMDPDNALRILRGEQFIDLIPERFRHRIQDKRITRVVKADDGGGSFQVITDPDEVIKLAGRPGSFDLEAEYGVPGKLIEALDTTTQLAMAAGLDALREAGIPLVQTFKPTTTGKFLPDRWLLPVSMRDETGVIFASAFPGGDRFAQEMANYYAWQNRLDQLKMLEDLRQYASDAVTLQEINRRIVDLREQMERQPYFFDRRFLFRILAMGHSQFAEYIGARGPNTQVNAACASTAQAVAIAEDWIRSGRCRRVIVVGADNVTGDNLIEWVGAGFLATGAAATDNRVDLAALPFDKRRHGTLLGMGACALVVESEDAVRERGMRGIVELLSSESSNSAFHGTRLDVDHISLVMENLVAAAERRFGLNRYAVAPQMVFMSHETFTPARGGSAAAEVVALRKTFGEAANDIIVANTKGFTGHPMGVGVEDVIAIKALEYGIVPPVPNFKEVDPDLGVLNLSRGGRYPVQYAMHLAAGFGSQIAMTFTRRIPGGLDRIDNKARYQRWLADVSGYDNVDAEVVKRVLRVKSNGVPGRAPVGSSWQYGLGPSVRAAAPGDGVAPAFAAAYRPAPMAEVAALLGKKDGSGKREAGSEPQPAPAPGPTPPPALVKVAPAPIPPAPAPAPVRLESRDQRLEAPPAPAQSPISNLQSPTPVADPVVTQVLSLVAAKTGYPQDMLELDLDLEADLGIDTVKQAETFAAVRETFAIPLQEGLSLRDYPTLASVVGFVRAMRPDLGRLESRDQRVEAAPAPAPSPISNLQPPTPAVPTIGTLEDADKMPRRVPVPALRPAIDLCKPTGVALDEGSRVVVMLDRGGVGKALVNRLEKLGVSTLVVEPGAATADLDAQLKAWLAGGPIQGVYWLPALDVEPNLEDMTLADWRELNRQRVKNLYTAMRALYESVRGPGRFLVSATRLGGLHGYGPEGATAPLGGAVTGFSKAYNIEQGMKPEGQGLLVKAVDFEISRKTADPADQLIAETLYDPGAVEIGYHDGLRFAITLVEKAARDGNPGMMLGPETVFAVTGAAGGITSAIVTDLAVASRGVFYLLDLVPCPARDDANVRLFRSDKEALKLKLIEDARSKGEKPTPKQIDQQIIGIERSEAALRAVETAEAAGARVHYFALDLRDGEAVSRVVEDIRARYGKIDVLLHAGGLLIDRTLPNKEPNQFDLVFDVKA
ncbi:MAG: SDR family NAD(P)-dependent oxidoreductase, partial [Caldilineales bacterium]|nr:SDR family NAD(P)-dependent oxidoreductase [Caldilineales bacterium]